MRIFNSTFMKTFQLSSSLSFVFWAIILTLYGMLFFVPPSSIIQSSSSSTDMAKGRKVRIFCIVLTQPKNHKMQAKVVKETWGRRCDKLVFVSSLDNPDLPAVSAGVPEGREYLWGKTRFGFKYDMVCTRRKNTVY